MRLLPGILTLLFCTAALSAQPAVLVDDVQADEGGRQWAEDLAAALQNYPVSVFVASRIANAPEPGPAIASGASAELESLGMPGLPGQPDPGEILDDLDPALVVVVLPPGPRAEVRLGAVSSVTPRPVTEQLLAESVELGLEIRRDLLFSRLGIGSDIGLQPYLQDGMAAFAIDPGSGTARIDPADVAALVPQLALDRTQAPGGLPEQNYLLLPTPLPRPGRTLLLGETMVAVLLWAAGLALTFAAAILRSASRRYRRSLRQNRTVILRSLVEAWTAFAMAGLFVSGLFRLVRWPGGYLETPLTAFVGRVAVALAIGGVFAVLPRVQLRRTNSSAYSAAAIAISVVSTAAAVFIDPALALLLIASLFCVIGGTLLRPPWLKLLLVLVAAVPVAAFAILTLNLAGPGARGELLVGPILGAGLLAILALPTLLSLQRLRLILPFTRHVHRRRRTRRALVVLVLAPLAAALVLLPRISDPVREITVTLVVRSVSGQTSARVWIDSPRPTDLSDLRALFPPADSGTSGSSDAAWRLASFPPPPAFRLQAIDAGPQRRRIQLAPNDASGANAALANSPMRVLLPESALLLSSETRAERRPGGGEVDFPAGIGAGTGFVLSGPAGGTVRVLQVSDPFRYRVGNLRVLQTTVFALQVPLP